MSLGPIATNPAAVVQATTDTIYWAVDTTLELDGQTFATVVSVTLTNLSTGTAVALTGSPSVSGNVVTCPPVPGSSLNVGDVYRLAVVFSTTAGNTLTAILTINVPA